MKRNIRLLETAGVKKQAFIWVEEMAELQQAITKWMRKYEELDGDITPELRKNIIGEYVDVCICMEQLKYAIGGISESEFDTMYQFKINREFDRRGLSND